MSISEITHYLDIGLLVLFIFVLVTIVLYFLRGLLRGWRYGTYRLIAFAVLFLIAFFTLGPIAEAIGNWDMQSFGLPAISYTITNNGNTYNISASFGSPFSVIQSLIKDTLTAVDANMSPSEIQAYAIAFSKSLMMLITLFLDGLLLATLGNLFVMLLWHIAFIHTIPKDKRQEAKKKGKLISGFEELVIGVVIGAMMLFPFTSMVNSLAYGWNQTTDEEKTSLSANNETYKTVQAVVDTYNNSLFSQVFFAWTKNNGSNMSYDMALTNFLTQGSYSDASVGVINELTSFAKMGSLLVEGGLISDKGFDQTKLPLFLTSRFAPELLRSLSQSSLISGLLPYALDVVQNIGQVATYLKVGKGIKFENFKFNATFSTLADIYDSLLKDDVLKTALIGSDGKWGTTSDILTAVFSDDTVEPMHKLLSALDSDSLAVFDAVIEAAVYVACYNDHQNVAANPSEYAGKITISDFFPSIKNAVALDDENAKVPEEFTNLKWGEEIATIFDASHSIVKSDPSLIVTLTEGIKDGGYTINTDHLTSGIFDHLDAYAAGLFGVTSTNSTNGALAAESTTATSCLLDSSFVENAMPKLLTVMQDTLNTSFNLTNNNALDLTNVKAELKLTDSATMDERKTAVKAEFGSLYNVVKAFVATPEGKAFLKDTTGKPGLYFDPDGKFVGIAPGLLKGLTSGIRLLDTSKLSKAILPGLFKGFMEGDSSPLKTMGITGLNLDFSGDKLGTNLADLLDVFNANQGIISYLLSFGGTINASNADGVLKGILSFKDGDGNSQLGNLLKALVGNAIINPEGSNNIKLLIEPYLKQMGFDTTSLALPTDPVDLKNEMDNFVGVLQAISSQEALGELMNGNVSIASLAKINFTEIFTAINQSSILKTILGAYLDTKVLPSFSGILTSEEIATYKIGFSNISNWAAEGAALDALIKAAAEIGDLNKIDYLHSDPEAVSSIINALAGSGMFQAKQTDGSVKYVFPSYMANKLASYFADNPSYGQFFADAGAVADSQTGKFDASKDFSRFIADFSSINTVAGWQGDANSTGESARIADVIRYVLRLDGFTTISASTDWRTVNRANLQGLLKAVADSTSFGPILTYHLYASTIEAMGSSMPALTTLSNTDYLLDSKRTTLEREKEVGYLYDMISAAVDPGFGLLDSNGKLPTSSSNFKLANVSADFLVNPLLTSLSSSQVFNSLKSGESYTAFEEEYAQILVDNSLYTDKTAVEAIIMADFRTPEGTSNLTAWNAEIEKLCTLLTDAKALDLDLAALDFNALFSKSNSAELNESNRAKVEEALKAYNKSKTLGPSLPDLLKKAVGKVVDSMKSSGVTDADDYGLATANFTYNGSDAYSDNEIHCLSYILEDGLIIDFTNLGVKDAKAGSSVANLLENMAKSAIFNSVKQGGTETETTLEKTMQKVLLKSGYYGTATDATVRANVKTVVLEVKKSDYGWIGDTGEIAKLEAVASALPTDTTGTDLDLNAFSLTSFFGNDETTQEQQRAKLETFLGEVNSSALLYPGLAAKVDSAITSNNTSTIDLSGANSYYTGHFSYHDATDTLVKHTSLGAQYTSEEITILTRLFKDVSGLGNVDLSDISKIDAVKVTTLLKDMVQSRVFNTSADASKQPVAQKVMSQALLAGGALDSTYYFASNPKDIAGNSASNYSDSATKASYLAKTYFTQDSSHKIAQTSLDLIDGDTGSIKSVILAVKTGGISTAVQSNNYASLSESDLTTLLGALNDCKLYQDCVPNLLANAVTGSMASAISGVNLSRANPYYIYYEPASGFVYGDDAISYSYDSADKVIYSLVSYENKYEDTEIATLARLITKLNDTNTTNLFASSSTTNFNYSVEDIQTIHDLLTLLSKSYVFNLGGPYGGNVDITTPSALHVNDDLSVFEQALFNFLDQSGMAAIAYDQAYDYQIRGTYAAESKLYTAFKTFESDFGKSSGLSGNTLHSGKWQDEIDYLTVHTTNSTIDGGLLYILRTDNNGDTWNIVKGGSLSNLKNMSLVAPSTIKVMLKAMNQVDLAHDAVPYTVASLIEDTLKFKTYSTISLSATPNASTFSTDSLGNRGHYNALSVTLDSEMASGTYPTVYAYDSTYAGASKIQVGLTDSGHTAGTTIYTFDMGKTYPYYFSIDAGTATISSLSYSFNSSNYILTQSEFLSDEGSGKTALDVIGDFADSIYITKTGGSKGYVDFTNSDDVSTLFAGMTPSTSPTGAHLSSILRYIGATNGFYTRNFYTADASYSPATSSSYDFASRDIVLRRMLSFSYNGTAIDLGKYFAESQTDLGTYEGAKDIFTANGYSAETEGDWFTNNFTNVGVTEAGYANVVTTVGGISIPKIHAYAEAFVKASGSALVYNSTLETTADAAAAGAARLGKYIAAGQLQGFVSAATSYAFPDTVVAGSYLNFNNLAGAPSSYYAFTNRKSLLPSGFVNPSFYSDNFALLGTTSLANSNAALKILHNYFEVTSLLNLTSVTANPGATSYPLSTGDKATIITDYGALDAYLLVGTSAEQRLIQTLYLSTVYDDCLNRLYYHGLTLSTPEVDFFMLPSNTQTLSSTLPSIPTA